MQVKQTIKYRKTLKREDMVNPNYPLHYIDENRIRKGFERGDFKRVTIELKNGNTIIYEAKESEGDKVKICPKAHTVHQRTDLPFVRSWITCEDITIGSRTWNTEENFDAAIIQTWSQEVMSAHNEDYNE